MGALRFVADEVKKHIESLIAIKKVIPFVAANGRTYHWLKNFFKHQRLNNPAIPKLPLPDWIIADSKRYRSGKLCGRFAVSVENLPEAYRNCVYNQRLRQKSLTDSLPVNGREETETERELPGEIENEKIRSYEDAFVRLFYPNARF